MWIYSVLIILSIWQSHIVNCKLGCLKGVCDNEIREKYEPTWESLDRRPLPEWYDEAKVGIFLHWGVYSVPSFGSEWFWSFWQQRKLPEYIDFMKRNYKPGFTYQEFANEFTAELFNATQWALLFRDSGAKYVVLTSKHHDGYGLWPSSRSFGWNAKDIGPNMDIIKELSSSLRLHTDLKFGLYYSLFEWFNRMYVDDEQNQFVTRNYVEYKALPDLHEIISLYAPEILWSDGDLGASPTYWDSLNFLAWLYNSSPMRDTVVTNDRWGNGTMCYHGDFFTCSDRYNPGVLQKHKWENAMTIDKTTWGNRYDTTLKDFLTTKELVSEIASTVSCGGNILINVGPNKHGTIQPIFEERLREMGNWLKVNGEAIYASKPWIYQNDTITKGVWYTKNDDNNGRTNVYAMVLEYPYDSNAIDLYSLGGKTDGSTKITLLGLSNEKIKWSATKESLHVQFPLKNIIDKQGLSLAWTFKINIASNI